MGAQLILGIYIAVNPLLILGLYNGYRPSIGNAAARCSALPSVRVNPRIFTS